jgi:hypothetical protein
VAKIRSTSAKHAADVRWTNYRKLKENNEPFMRAGNPSKSKSIYSEILSESEKRARAREAPPQEVAEVDNFGTPQPPTKSIGTHELAAVVHAKGWR